MLSFALLARSALSNVDKVGTTGVTSESQFSEVEMTYNPAYGPVATTAVDSGALYEEVAHAAGDSS